MEIESYRTITNSSQGIYKEKGSRFLVFAFPVSDDDQIKNCLASLRKEYYDARHHCYAWMLGAEKARFRANDDGEPNHSAGDPILGQIRSRDLTNVLVVVVRYFGGTKLGVGGLIAAYKTATEDALNRANIVVRPVTRSVEIIFPYSNTAEVMRLVKDFDLEIADQRFEEDCRMICRIGVRRVGEFRKAMELLRHLQSTIRASVDGIPA